MVDDESKMVGMLIMLIIGVRETDGLSDFHLNNQQTVPGVKFHDRHKYNNSFCGSIIKL